MRDLLVFLLLTSAACTAGPGDPESFDDSGDVDDLGDGKADSVSAWTRLSRDLPDPSGLTRYPGGVRHSPITPAVAASMARIAARDPSLQGDVFAKIGDSITFTPTFMSCFATSKVDLGGREDLRPTLELFAGGDAAGKTPFDRKSVSAVVGWSASAAVSGSPAPLEREWTALSPRYAVVMYGTNDTGARSVWNYAENMMRIVDGLVAHGTVPILSTIPPRDDNATANALVPLFNTIVRGIAQAHQIPLVDFNKELLPLARHGLGGDRIHPSNDSRGACFLDAAGLTKGMNVRNLLELEALGRARAAVEDGAAPDARGLPALAGDGSHAAPLVIDQLPFTDLRSSSSGESTFASYACGPQNESGPEVLYRLDVAATTKIRVRVFARGGVDVDVHLLDSVDSATCRARGDKELSATLAPGSHVLAVDTFKAAAGEYLLVIMPA